MTFRSLGNPDCRQRPQFDNGQKSEAVKTQKRAIDLVEDAEMKAEFEKSLKRYQQP